VTSSPWNVVLLHCAKHTQINPELLYPSAWPGYAEPHCLDELGQRAGNDHVSVPQPIKDNLEMRANEREFVALALFTSASSSVGHWLWLFGHKPHGNIRASLSLSLFTTVVQ
jgi:hypothetical protein